MTAVAIVGLACELPDAASPEQLWQNVLARRRAFRTMPPERLSLADYFSADRAAPDALYATEAALIEGYAFDRVRFRVPGAAFRAADPAHWLALDVACRALSSAGFPDGDGALPRETTGVVLGNTLTGEYTRAALMRLRWPYVRRVVDAAMHEHAVDPELRGRLLAGIEETYKAPFEPVGDESLAGALSNTIAGRICNHLDLGGGGYTVDGACAASLLAVITACERLATGELDVAVAGGVDVSLDPFELVGFAKTGALASDEMRVYDARSQGFWPGEGSAFVVLMRHADARARGMPVHALIRGWGVSSDGRGGITRPEVAGQVRALRRAYARARIRPATVAYFEGHGTGTAVGDATELRAITTVRSPDGEPPAAIGSVKANIGHTKAAAGVAGLLKAALAVREGVIPPMTGCPDPHPELLGSPVLRVAETGDVWPSPERVAGVSAMGFGGINTHLVLTAESAVTRPALTGRERLLLRSAQDCELFLLAGTDSRALAREIERLRARAASLSRAELGDAARALADRAGEGTARAAIVASRAAELDQRLAELAGWLDEGVGRRMGTGVFLSLGSPPPRIGLLFPGQGSPLRGGCGALARRFPFAAPAMRVPDRDTVATDQVQPAIVAASLAALQVLDALGLHADVAVGHSLGELTGLVWAGAIDAECGQRIAAARGRAMSEFAEAGGAMASLALGREAAETLADGLPLVAAGVNAPDQTVLSGPSAAIDAVLSRGRARNIVGARLQVSHAFHSPAMAPAEPALARVLERERFAPPRRPVISTVTGDRLTAADDLRALLRRQLTAPVRFADALTTASEGLDLLVEAGPGRVLTRIAASVVPVPAYAIDAGGPSLAGLLSAAGAAWVLGAALRTDVLFTDRFTRPVHIDRPPRLFSNPCERAPRIDTPVPSSAPPSHDVDASVEEPPRDRLDLVRELVAHRAELPLPAVTADSRLLDDLHLNSIVVSEIAVEAARRLGLPPPLAPSALATATVAMLADALADGDLPGPTPGTDVPGAGSWTRAFAIRDTPRPRPATAPDGDDDGGRWRVVAPAGYSAATALEHALAADRRSGVALCIPPELDGAHLPLFLEAARLAERAGRLLVLQTAGGGAGFAAALHLELPQVATCVVDAPAGARGIGWAAEEAMAHAAGFIQVRYDPDGVRYEPVLCHLPVAAETHTLAAGDVLLVVGGARGIAAECALALAGDAAIAFLGRADPAADAALAANLERLRALYVRADATDRDAVRAAVDEVERAVGRVTAVLYAAGRNEPTLIQDLDGATLAETVAPKVTGLRNVLAAVARSPLRLLVTLGSVIARAGLRGEAHYALANEWQTRLTERFAASRPECRCLALESSVWSSVGMGERLGSIEGLARQGVEAIPPEGGAKLLARVAAMSDRPVAVVAAGRLGRWTTLERERSELPLRRFLERPVVHYPGIELVADADLSPELDPYLDDHVLDGERLLPAVIGLEAMAQAVMALTGADGPPCFEDVRLERPIVVPAGERTTVRVAVLADDDGGGRVVLRSARTGFQVEHFTARWAPDAPPADEPPPHCDDCGVPLDPADLYGSLLFQAGRFRRLRRYLRLTATECVAEVERRDPTGWFGHYLPQQLVLGDAGARDAVLHVLQACVPQARVVPTGIARFAIAPFTLEGPLYVHARERARERDAFTFDIVVTDARGSVVERWEGVQLRAVAPATMGGAWPAPLLANYLERWLEPLDRSLRIAIMATGGSRHERSDDALRQAAGAPTTVRRRPDGKPLVDGRHASTAHVDGLTLAVTGAHAVACDIEEAVTRPADVWRDLLGAARTDLSATLAADRGEVLDIAATRVWAAIECLQKVGAPITAPLTIRSGSDDGWLLLASGERTVATYVAQVRAVSRPVTVAVLTEGGAGASL